MKEKNLIDLLQDCKTCLTWLRILEDGAEYKLLITQVINRVQYYIDEEEKDH